MDRHDWQSLRDLKSAEKRLRKAANKARELVQGQVARLALQLSMADGFRSTFAEEMEKRGARIVAEEARVGSYHERLRRGVLAFHEAYSAFSTIAWHLKLMHEPLKAFDDGETPLWKRFPAHGLFNETQGIEDPFAGGLTDTGRQMEPPQWVPQSRDMLATALHLVVRSRALVSEMLISDGVIQHDYEVHGLRFDDVAAAHGVDDPKLASLRSCHLDTLRRLAQAWDHAEMIVKRRDPELASECFEDPDWGTPGYKDLRL